MPADNLHCNTAGSRYNDPWSSNMRKGDFETAWEIADADQRARSGRTCWHLPRHLQYIWDGSSLEGKSVLVRCYHGLGDTIQFIRFIERLKTVAGEVIVWTQPKLIPLLKSVKGIDRLEGLHDGTPHFPWDTDLEVMELAHVFRVTTSELADQIPYIFVDAFPLPPTGKLRVGLVWKAGDWDASRSLEFTGLIDLFNLKGIEFYISQPGALAAGWNEMDGIYPGEFDVYDYARHLKSLDLLISIDSMPVHLAGAMGLPVWTLLPFDADWRWMENRADSPWYPTMRLFRQERPGDWQGVIARVVAALKEIAPPA